MRKFLVIMSFGLLAALPLGTRSGGSTQACREATSDYPDHPLSPRESLQAYDTVFFGEVLVPKRKCSLGSCAGLRVMQTIKGRPGLTALLRLPEPGSYGAQPCAAQAFQAKGGRWLVFANQGTSPGGQRYFDTGDDSPSFATNEAPNFEHLESRYRMVRARLDEAIGDRMAHWR